MNLSPQFRLSGLLFILSCLLWSCDSGPDDFSRTAGQPNIIYILADDLGYGDLGSYGQKDIQTPNLDRMAAEGIRFTDHYAGSTVCAPSRSVLMTGLHTGRTPIRGNSSIDEQANNMPLPEGAVTISTVLKEAGYYTSIFGKWGLGGPGSSGSPLNQGFDEFYGFLSHRHAHFFYPEFLYRGEDREPLPGNRVIEEKGIPGAGLNSHKETYSHDAVMEEAISFVKRQGEYPFFMFLSLQIPHAEMLVPEKALQAYLDEDGNSIFEENPYPPGRHYGPQKFPTAAYAAMVTHMDRDIGRLLDLLKEQGLDENTLVIFSSDNGSHAEGGYHPDYLNSSGPLRGFKRDLYEGGIRVPAIARWPGQIEAGSVSDHISGFQDMLPTFANLAGVRPPADIDGISMVPVLLGQPENQERHEYLYWEFHEQGGKQAVRKGNWKAVRLDVLNNPGAPIELYNLEDDLSEQINIADRHPEIVSEMKKIMEQAHRPSESFPFISTAE